MTFISLRGDALHLPLQDESVDLIVTSPPYWAQRAYTDGGVTYAGQLGSEDTPAEFIGALLDATAEWVRVLKPSGSLFVNLGDKFATRWGSSRPQGRRGLDKDDRGRGRWGRNASGVPEKSLIGLPWRYALGCIDELGLTLRSEIVWSKANGLPESVTDRVRSSHEHWFHFTLAPRYYSAIDTIREPHKTPNRPRLIKHRTAYHESVADNTGWRDTEGEHHSLGRLPGSVWEINTEPLELPEWVTNGDDHYAAFPAEWPRRLILGWSPEHVCTVCGQGRRPVVDKSGDRPVIRARRRIPGYTDPAGVGTRDMAYEVLGWVCACTPFTDHPGTGEPSPTAVANGRQGARPIAIGDNHRRVGPHRQWHLDGWTAPATTPGVVLDPLGGTGTTAHVAHALGRTGISVDLSAGYARLASDTTLARRRYAKINQIPAPAWTGPDDLLLFP